MTVIEALQKQKKQKEEKVMPLGQAVVDLLPLLQGTTSIFSSSINISCSPALVVLCSRTPLCKLPPSDKNGFHGVFRKLGLWGEGGDSSCSALEVVAAQLWAVTSLQRVSVDAVLIAGSSQDSVRLRSWLLCMPCLPLHQKAFTRRPRYVEFGTVPSLVRLSAAF